MKFFTVAAITGLTLTPLLVFADDSFIALTSLPGLSTITNSASLPAFLNQLYRLSIGAVAVLAVLQITYAGWQFMTSADSITKNRAAKERIQNSIFGLVLVLSPALIFGFINPQILDLSLDFSSLAPGELTQQQNTSSTTQTTTQGDGSCNVDCVGGFTCKAGRCVAATPAAGSCTTFAQGSTPIGDDTNKQACCQAQNGCRVTVGQGGGGEFGLQTVCTCQ